MMNESEFIHFVPPYLVPCLMLTCSTAFSDDNIYRGNGECLVLPINARSISISRFRGQDRNKNMLLGTKDHVMNNHLRNDQVQSSVIAHSFKSEQLEGGNYIFLRSSMHKDYGEKIAGIPLTASILLKAIIWLGFNTDYNNERALEIALNQLLQYFDNHDGTVFTYVHEIQDTQLQHWFSTILHIPLLVPIHDQIGVRSLFVLYLERLERIVPAINWSVEAIQDFMNRYEMGQPDLPGDTSVHVRKFHLLRQIYMSVARSTKVIISVVDGQHRLQTWWYILNHMNPSFSQLPDEMDTFMTRLFLDHEDSLVQRIVESPFHFRYNVPSIIDAAFCDQAQETSRLLQTTIAEAVPHSYCDFLALVIEKMNDPVYWDTYPEVRAALIVIGPTSLAEKTNIRDAVLLANNNWKRVVGYNIIDTLFNVQAVQDGFRWAEHINLQSHRQEYVQDPDLFKVKVFEEVINFFGDDASGSGMTMHSSRSLRQILKGFRGVPFARNRKGSNAVGGVFEQDFHEMIYFLLCSQFSEHARDFALKLVSVDFPSVDQVDQESDDVSKAEEAQQYISLIVQTISHALSKSAYAWAMGGAQFSTESANLKNARTGHFECFLVEHALMIVSDFFSSMGKSPKFPQDVQERIQSYIDPEFLRQCPMVSKRYLFLVTMLFISVGEATVKKVSRTGNTNYEDLTSIVDIYLRKRMTFILSEGDARDYFNHLSEEVGLTDADHHNPRRLRTSLQNYKSILSELDSRFKIRPFGVYLVGRGNFGIDLRTTSAIVKEEVRDTADGQIVSIIDYPEVGEEEPHLWNKMYTGRIVQIHESILPLIRYYGQHAKMFMIPKITEQLSPPPASRPSSSTKRNRNSKNNKEKETTPVGGNVGNGHPGGKGVRKDGGKGGSNVRDSDSDFNPESEEERQKTRRRKKSKQTASGEAVVPKKNNRNKRDKTGDPPNDEQTPTPAVNGDENLLVAGRTNVEPAGSSDEDDGRVHLNTLQRTVNPSDNGLKPAAKKVPDQGGTSDPPRQVEETDTGGEQQSSPNSKRDTANQAIDTLFHQNETTETEPSLNVQETSQQEHTTVDALLLYDQTLRSYDQNQNNPIIGSEVEVTEDALDPDHQRGDGSLISGPSISHSVVYHYLTTDEALVAKISELETKISTIVESVKDFWDNGNISKEQYDHILSISSSAPGPSVNPSTGEQTEETGQPGLNEQVDNEASSQTHDQGGDHGNSNQESQNGA